MNYKSVVSNYFLLTILCLWCFACASETDNEPDQIAQETPDTSYLDVAVDRLRVRSAPNLQSQTRGLLAEGSKVQFWGEQTTESITIELRGEKIEAPWYLIRQDTILGWVFSGALETLAQEEGLDLLIIPGQRVGPILASDTEQEIIAKIGGEHVERGDYMIGEGVSVQATYVFPSTERELIVLWKEEDFEHLHEVRISRKNSPWETLEGLRVGSSLQEVEKANGAPFQLSGFGWDYAGTTLNWQGGSIDEHLFVVFAEPDDVHKSLIGDHTISSDDRRLVRANPVIKAIRIQF